MSKNALWAMLQGQVTPETTALSKKAAMVTAVTDEKNGKVSVSESAVSYGSLAPDPYGRVSDKRIVVESPSLDRYNETPLQGQVESRPQNTPVNYKVEASPDKILTMISGDKTAIKEMKKNLHNQPSQSYQQPVYTSQSPVVDAMNEAMGYATQTYQPQPQMLNEAEMRSTINKIIKEELETVLLQNIFSENRMMTLYQEQLKKTLTKIIEQKVAQAKRKK
jgi:uncharacterized protein YlzI (FlbEa/FlbD family)